MNFMYNLKETVGTYKGLIGECLFKIIRKYVIVTKFFNKNKYFKIFGDRLSNEEREFLDKNWFSIDALEFDYKQKPRKIILFEIKNMNYQKNPLPYWKPKVTFATHKIYNEALSKGFDVKLAIIHLHENWDYNVEIKDFDKKYYSVDKDKIYDNKTYSNNSRANLN